MNNQFDQEMKALTEAHGIDNFVFQGMREDADSAVTMIVGNDPMKLMFLGETLKESVAEAMLEALEEIGQRQRQQKKKDMPDHEKAEAIRELLLKIMQ